MTLIERFFVGAALCAIAGRSELAPAQRRALVLFALTVPPLEIEAA